jgi:Zn finger protein HypA/HybF involved in hydrogenase expression
VHELSVAMEIARIAELELGARAPQLVSVGVTVGDRAGIEPANLEFCLEAVLSTPPFRGAKGTILPVAGDELQVAYLEVDDGDSTN